MTTAQFAFCKLFVSDLDAMIAFYVAAFDMAVHMRLDDSDFEEVLLRQDGHGFLLGLLSWKDGRDRGAPAAVGVVGFVTADADGAVAKAQAAGATVTRAPFDIEGTRVALLHDPEGHEIEFVQFL